MCRPLPSTASVQVKATLLGPDGLNIQTFELPDHVSALRFIALLRATSYCRSAQLFDLTPPAPTGSVAP